MRDRARANPRRYDALPGCHQDAILLGSGLVGAMVFQGAPDTLNFLMGRADVYSKNKEVFPHRKPIGHCTLRFDEPIQSGTAEIDIFGGVAELSLEFAGGQLALLAYCHAIHDALIVDVANPAPSVEWRFYPHRNPQSARSRIIKPFDNGPFEPADLSKWTEESVQFASTIYHERGIVGGELVAGAVREASTSGTRLFCTLTYDREMEGTAREDARELMRKLRGERPPALQQAHEQEWARHIGRSYLAIPDQELQQFVDFQFYKLRALTKPGGALIDLQGVWFDPTTPWPGVWHNLNSQLTYWLCATGNRMDLMEPIISSMVKHQHEFAKMGADAGEDCYALYTVTSAEFAPSAPNRPPLRPTPPERSVKDGTAYHGPDVQDSTLGNFLWLMHNVWQAASYSDDRHLMQEMVVPFLRKGIRFYQAFLEERPDGSLHIPETFSPEYRSARNCSYDLAILRWALTTYLAEAPDSSNAADMAKLRDVLARLPDYAWSDENGYMIGDDVALTDAHRHYSHLLMAYPFFDRNITQPGEKVRIQKSVAHWQSYSASPFDPHPSLVGYSFTGAASIYAAIGEGDMAYAYLRAFLDTGAGGRMRSANTQYYEHAGDDATTVEVPLTGAVSTLDMLLQSWGGTLRLFPAIPKGWRDVSFFNLAAEGGIAVSAVLDDGKIVFLALKSKADRTVVFECPFDLREPCGDVTQLDDRSYCVQLNGAETKEIVGRRPE